MRSGWLRYFLYGAVLFFLGCGSTPCALSGQLSDSQMRCRECRPALSAAALPDPGNKLQAAASTILTLHTNRQNPGRAQAGFYVFASTPACIGPCKPDATVLGSDLLSNPEEDLYSWEVQANKGKQPDSEFLGRPAFNQPAPHLTASNQPAPDMSTFWQDPSQADYYWQIGSLTFSGAETNNHTHAAGIKWVIPLN